MRWRKAFGIARDGTPGSKRLIQAAACQGADAIKQKEWTDEERAARRKQNRELGLAQHLKAGYIGPRWTDDQIALLGKLSDDEVAERTGRTTNAVRIRRERLGIADPVSNNRWTRAHVVILGTIPDKEAAVLLGRTLTAVRQKRRAKHYKRYRQGQWKRRRKL